MSNEFQNNLIKVIQGLEMPELVDEKIADRLLRRYIVEFPETSTVQTPEIIRQIEIALSKEGNITKATSLKIPNLRFKLGEFLLETASFGISASKSSAQPVSFVVVCLRFIQKVCQLAKLTIIPIDAEVLIAIYKLVKEKEIITVDNLIEALKGKLPEPQITKSLETLDSLSCITLSMQEIVLNEDIVFLRAE